MTVQSMEMGVVGLGRMGAGIGARLRKAGHTIVGYDVNPAVSEVASLSELVQALPSRRVIWLMIPAGQITEDTLAALTPLLSPEDIVIDGGNSYYKDSIRRGMALAEVGVQYLDIGTSGGIWGLENGFCLMVGGPEEAFAFIEPLLMSLAPPEGYAYVGPSGAGHFAKMVHNGIEYGMLEAYAEGFELLHSATEYGYDFQRLARLWNTGSVIRSWMLELAALAFDKDAQLEHLKAYVEDSGEGRWTVQEAVERGVSAGVLSQALFARFASRDDNAFSMRLIAALRNEFGGHRVKTE